MKNAINWKLFAILLVASVATGLMVLPYALMLIPEPIPAPLSAIIAGALIQTIVIFSIAIFIGLLLVKRVGFGLPILEGVLKGEPQGKYLRSILPLSAGLGVLASVLIILLSVPFESLSSTFLKAEMGVAVWKSFLASFYGGIAEEVLLRLFLVTLFVWISFKIKKTADNKPTAVGIWISIILASIIFGLGHLPITGAVTAITPAVVLRAVLLNGVAGVIFGWLYWRKGLESAMISHFTADICLHVVTPLVAAVIM